MTGMEKLIWTEFLVSLAAVVLVALLYPWLGDAAAGGFGLLGLMVLGAWFTKRRGAIVDERDRKIEQESRWMGIGTAWIITVLGLILFVQFSVYREKPISIRMLNWLVWISFASLFIVKGLCGIRAYRRASHAP